MADSKPRYEFRTFAQNFGIAETKMRHFSKCENIRESSEIYIVSRRNNENNTNFTVNNCITEIAEVLINGAAIKTVAIESTDIEAILKAKDMLCLTEYENVNYLLAIKRIIGMEPPGKL